LAEQQERQRERQWRKWQRQSGLLDHSQSSSSLSVCRTGSAKSGTEKTQLFSTTSAIFRCSRLLIAD
jgi:hypothetical protein